jgi:SAM-dependent methyltransferase
MRENQSNIGCPSCKNHGAYRDRVVHGYDVMVCTECGLAFTWPRPTEAEVAEFYHSLDIDTNLYGGQSPTKRAFFALCHQQIESFILKGRILDFGCGDCCFLNEAQSDNFELFGADLHSGIERIQHPKKIKFFIGPIVQNGTQNNFFDVVFTSATYEHFLYPNKMTEEFYRILKPGGALFIVSVPSYESTNIRLNIEDWLINRPPAHINFFNLKSMRKHLEQQGFEISKCWTYGFNLEPIRRKIKGITADVSLKELVESVNCTSTREIKKVRLLHRLAAKAYFQLPCFGVGDKLAFIAIKPQNEK